MSLKKIVIANRGEIARRVMRAANVMGLEAAIIVAAGDEDGVGPALVAPAQRLPVSSYLDKSSVISAAKNWGADAIHPGYGFLSENAEFAALVEGAGLAFIGPTSEQMQMLGDKENSKKLAKRLGVPVLEALYSQDLSSTTSSNSIESALLKQGIFAPWLVKASGGGGGRGMRVVHHASELSESVTRASSEALAGFGNPAVFIERYLENARHIEIQVFGDGLGGGVALGERECSLQRRHQKVIEEAPSPVMFESLRQEMGRAALRFVQETKYRGAGTVEFLLTPENEFIFLEMNTRLQVEHPVTEEVFGIDLVQAQILLAQGIWMKDLGDKDNLEVRSPVGHAIEVRLLAEDPLDGFKPTPGAVVAYREPAESRQFSQWALSAGGRVRVESGLIQGARVNPAFDSMVLKLVTFGKDRGHATALMKEALSHTVVSGFSTNHDFLQVLLNHEDFVSARFHTRWIESNLESCLESCLKPRLEMFFKNLPVARLIRDHLNGTSRKQMLGSRFESALQSNLKVEVTAVCGSFFDLLISGKELKSWACNLQALPGSHRLLGAERLAGWARGEPLACVASYSKYSVLRLNIAGIDVVVDISKEEASERTVSLADASLVSPMPGKLLLVKVRPGQWVAEGEVLFVMESMKMQIEIRAARAGEMNEVFVTEEQMVEAGYTLGKLKETEI